MIVGRIVPAIGTTTATVSGLVSVHFYEIVILLEILSI